MTKGRKIAIAIVSVLLVLALCGILSVFWVFLKPKPEVVEKEVIKYVEVPVEVEKIVEVPTEVIKYVETNKIAPALRTTLYIADCISDNEWANATRHTEIAIDVATFTMQGGGNTGKVYVDDFTWRMYASEFATITISPNENYHLVGLIVNYFRSGDGTLLTADNASYASGELLLLNGNAITFHCNEGTGQARITSIDLIYCEKVGD